jgi:hypothetical protein
MKTDEESNYCSNDHNRAPKPSIEEGASAKEELSNQIASQVD